MYYPLLSVKTARGFLCDKQIISANRYISVVCDNIYSSSDKQTTGNRQANDNIFRIYILYNIRFTHIIPNKYARAQYS